VSYEDRVLLKAYLRSVLRRVKKEKSGRRGKREPGSDGEAQDGDDV